MTFSYDADSNLIEETYPNGVVATFDYDQADQLASVTDAKGQTTLLTFSYTRNNDGLITSESSRTFGYDGLNRLTSDSLASASYTYDQADELIEVTNSTGTNTFGYDKANEVTSSTTSTGITTYAYDSQGNRTETTPPSGSPAAYAYDQANRLTAFSQGTTTASFAYNGDGLRMSKMVNDTPEGFAWDVAEGMPLVIGDGGTFYVTGANGLPLEQVAGSTVLYYHGDQLGTTRMLTDSLGAIAATYTYDAYGNLSSFAGSVTQPLGFAGQYTDSESGLIYLRVRYYDPETTQFISRDPAMMAFRPPYSYGVDDPVNRVDWTGLQASPGPQYPPAFIDALRRAAIEESAKYGVSTQPAGVEFEGRWYTYSNSMGEWVTRVDILSGGYFGGSADNPSWVGVIYTEYFRPGQVIAEPGNQEDASWAVFLIWLLNGPGQAAEPP